MSAPPHIAVIGAGAFGGWTALHLLRCGARVSLLDAWGPGNARSSSGGETRIMRGTYGPQGAYTRLAARALSLWHEHERRWQLRFFKPIGVLWLAGQDDAFERAAIPVLREAGMAVDELSRTDLTRRWPQINVEDVRWALLERDGGYVAARLTCDVVLDGFREEGGDYRELAVRPGALAGGSMSHVELSDGSRLAADGFVFACGPWLGTLFPDVLGPLVRVTRQEVFFFGTPSGDARFSEDALPVWADRGARFMYGIPGNKWRGFKVADDTPGPPFEPTAGERLTSLEGLRAVRAYVAFRFPGLADAPLVQTHVCQYENTPDRNLLIDRHPAARNVWLVGGGSGHGFKFGPALGELVADLIMADGDADALFRLSRFGS